MGNNVLDGRRRLASLCVSRIARSSADSCLFLFVVLQLTRDGQTPSEDACYQIAPFLVLPFILLAPVNGAISNCQPKRWVLVGSTGFCFCVAILAGTLLGIQGEKWLWCLALGLVKVGQALYSPACDALLPAAADDTGLSLGRVCGWMQMSGAVGIASGIVLGWYLPLDPWLAWPKLHDFPPTIAVVAALDLLALVTAWPVRFAEDIRPHGSAPLAIANFFRDSRNILCDKEARACLLGLAGLLGLMAAEVGVLLASTQPPALSKKGDASLFAQAHPGLRYQTWGEKRCVPFFAPELLRAIVVVSVGVALGSFLASVQSHPRRQLGLVPFGSIGLLSTLIWAATSTAPVWAGLVFGIMGGFVWVPLMTAYQAAVPALARGHGMAMVDAATYLGMTMLALLSFGLRRQEIVTLSGQSWVLVSLAAIGAILAWRTLLREAVEQIVELLLWPFYRIRAHGPGVRQIPLRGPLLAIANHCSWFDPLWLGKVIPRRITPMMTSRFFDLPVLRWLLTDVAKTIRVEASTFRREAPELQEAIAALDRGECVLIFPEAYMKRKEELPVRQFGQGVWRILRERPNTPVVICWIEGGWGSYTSYFGGPPTVNKRMDCCRPIDLGVDEPKVLDPTLLADQRSTRAYLMRACVDARRHLGLNPLLLQQNVPTEVLEVDEGLP